MNQYFIEATGPFSYNQSGIFYPYGQTINFVEMLRKHNITKHSWCRKNAVSGNDKVLCFASSEDLNGKSFGNDLPYGLQISKRTWR